MHEASLRTNTWTPFRAAARKGSMRPNIYARAVLNQSSSSLVFGASRLTNLCGIRWLCNVVGCWRALLLWKKFPRKSRGPLFFSRLGRKENDWTRLKSSRCAIFSLGCQFRQLCIRIIVVATGALMTRHKSWVEWKRLSRRSCAMAMHHLLHPACCNTLCINHTHKQHFSIKRARINLLAITARARA